MKNDIFVRVLKIYSMASRKFFLVCILSLGLFTRLFAVEGMWVPAMIGNNIEQMQQMGLQLSASDLYDEMQASLKDGIVRFGRGCTGPLYLLRDLSLPTTIAGTGRFRCTARWKTIT
jgi:hypothetical protein